MTFKDYQTYVSSPELMLSFVSNSLDSGEYSDRQAVIDFLNYTSNPEFLKKLDKKQRNDWAEICFKLIRKINYKLIDMMESRNHEIPDNILFQELDDNKVSNWTYSRIYFYLKQIAASFYSLENIPRVAILSENSLESACCDLACLSYDIFVTPLNVNFNIEITEYIFRLLKINVVVTDDSQRLEMLLDIKKKMGHKLHIFTSKRELTTADDDVYFLGEYETRLSNEKIDYLLKQRTILDVNQVCTVMFTSGSTGMPKGLSFTMYNLMTKRFARGAALPEIGENEMMLCYLPLYHTFGRYLEMMGTIYWRGTYVFAGNPSSETLLSLFPKINPSIFISVPLRWSQLYEKAVESMSEVSDSSEMKMIFKQTVGNRLRWGLSAAGYLDPKVFEFFSKNGVELCSGFGMTEATGGITMTEPYNYKSGTVGLPLPGITTRLDENSVLEIRGHYTARYLDDAKPYSRISYPDEEEFYISTGDVFRKDENGYFEIIDRVKDIYKNNKGQTVSPKNVENKFEGVPGIKRTFLIGDGKPYNTLFIIPDNDEEIISLKSEEEIFDYFTHIIMTANKELVPYERVINFTVLDRDFSADYGELTPKGSYNRRNIENNFKDEIEKLYIKNHHDIYFETLTIRIPRWFYRDLGIMESDIVVIKTGLLNIMDKKFLRLSSLGDSQFLIGDLIYEITGNILNLGMMARQPLLWAGNPNLFNFCPIKEGWDTALQNISENVFLPYQPDSDSYNFKESSYNSKISAHLAELHLLFCDIFFGENDVAEKSLFAVEKHIESNTERNINLIRKKLQTLARHPEESLRAEAYRILLLDEPSHEYSKQFPAFLMSGLSYLTEDTIRKIALGKLEIRRLEALRKRLLAYRTMIDLPYNDNIISQFENMFSLLYNFLKHNPDYYTSIRYEIISWMLYTRIPEISESAKKYFKMIHHFYEDMLDGSTNKYPEELWSGKLVFDDAISEREITLVKNVLINKAFLKQSIMLCFDENDFSIIDVKDRGAWISGLSNSGSTLHYRIVIAMKNNRRYDLQFFINTGSDDSEILNTILRHVAISGYPYGYRVLPKLGAYRQELKAWSFEYFGELSLWAKIREFSSLRITGRDFNKSEALRKYYIIALAAFFTGWRNSGKQIIPGIISPDNVIIPELDFRDGALINTINGWKLYRTPISIINDIIRNFYEKPIIHYPWLEKVILKRWIFDACSEALSIDETKEFLLNLKRDIKLLEDTSQYRELYEQVTEFESKLDKYFNPKMKIVNAIERYNEWLDLNPEASAEAKEQTIREVISLYNIDIKNEPERFYLYRFTYFKDFNESVHDKFAEIINKLYRHKDVRAIHLNEIAELQSLINDSNSRMIFTRMLFPKGSAEISIVRSENKISNEAVIKSYIKDNSGEVYVLREAQSPAEVGTLHRIFFKEKYPKAISEFDEYLVLLDSIGRIVGGICFRQTDDSSVLIDGSVVISSLANRGLGTAMLEDFCTRMVSKGYESVKTHFFIKNFYLNRGFSIDKRHGTLVRFLSYAPQTTIKGHYCII